MRWPKYIVVCPKAQGQVYGAICQGTHVYFWSRLSIDVWVIPAYLQKNFFGLLNVGAISYTHINFIATGIFHIVVDNISVGQLSIGNNGNLVAKSAQLGVEN